MSMHQKYNTLFLNDPTATADETGRAKGKYGVRVVEAANVVEGETYWKVVGVHHLLPEENRGMHNVFLEALDEQGRRMTNPLTLVDWGWQGMGGHEKPNPARLDKPNTEAAADIAINRVGQRIWVQVQGAKSDRVENLHTDHEAWEKLPNSDENGNYKGHHSFYVVFQKRVKSAEKPPKPPIISKPELSLKEALWAEAQSHRIALPQRTRFERPAREAALGERRTAEYTIDHENQPYSAQLYEKGLVYAPVGKWDKTRVIPTYQLEPDNRRDEDQAPFSWHVEMTGFKGKPEQYWKEHLQGKVAGLTWPVFRDGVLVNNPQLVADGNQFQAHKTYRIPGAPVKVKHKRPAKPIDVSVKNGKKGADELIIPWKTKMTGFKGNRWQYWDQHLKNKVPGLTWLTFMKDVVEQNPGLAGDGFVFQAGKTYRIPGRDNITINHRPGIKLPPNFVRVANGQIYLNGRPFKGMGLNIRGLLHYGHDAQYFKDAPLAHKRFQLLEARKLGARIIRVFLPHKDADHAEVTRRLRETLKIIKGEFPQMYLLPTLTNLYRDIPFYVKGTDQYYGPYADKDILGVDFFKMGYKQEYLAFVKHIVQTFKNEPHIFAWEIGNELKAEGDPDTFVTFNRSVSQRIKTWDPNHLVTTGMISTRHAWMQGREQLRQSLYGWRHIDFITIHAYNGNEDPQAVEDDSDLARLFKKPFIVEEAGFDVTKYSDRSKKTQHDVKSWFDRGASSYMLWGFMATADNNDGDNKVGFGTNIGDWQRLSEVFKQSATKFNIF